MHHTATNHLSSPSGRVLENCPDFVRELLPAVLTLEFVPGSYLADPVGAALPANWLAGPLDLPHVASQIERSAKNGPPPAESRVLRSLGFLGPPGCVSLARDCRPPGGRGVRLAPVVAFFVPTADVPQFGLNIAAGLCVEFLDSAGPRRRTNLCWPRSQPWLQSPARCIPGQCGGVCTFRARAVAMVATIMGDVVAVGTARYGKFTLACPFDFLSSANTARATP